MQAHHRSGLQLATWMRGRPLFSTGCQRAVYRQLRASRALTAPTTRTSADTEYVSFDGITAHSVARLPDSPLFRNVCIWPDETTLPFCSTLSVSRKMLPSASAETVALDAKTVPPGP